jgi:NADPH2 dehydrogenase
MQNMLLFEPISIKGLTLRNRTVMAPMCMYSALEGAKVSPFHRTHYATRAYGGLGLIIQEATGIEPRGRITDHDLGIWSDEHIEGLAALVDEVHAAGCKMAIQIAHAGRKSRATGEPIVSCTEKPFNEKYETPRALSIEEIHQVVAAFKAAARRARLSGYDAIEIHAAHGYLINQFLSPITNERQDEYGGSLPKRTRFLIEVIAAIRSEWTGPLWVRLSADEYEPSGHHLEETLKVIELIKDDIDAVNVSSGGVVPFAPAAYPGYQLEFAAAIKKMGLLTLGGA